MVLPKNVLIGLLGVTALISLAGCSKSAEQDADTDPANAQAGSADAGAVDDTEAAGPATALTNYVSAPYPMQTCVVSGERLGSMGQPVAMVHEGRQVKLCCANCEPRFTADPDSYLRAIDQAVVEQQLATYPMQTCPVSGDPLGDEPVNYVYENRLVRFCCEICIDTFLSDPGSVLAQINAAAVAVQMPDYPAENCPITGRPLGSMGKPIDMMVGHQLVRLCCSGCIEAVQENPAAALDTVYGSGEQAPEEDAPAAE